MGRYKIPTIEEDVYPPPVHAVLIRKKDGQSARAPHKGDKKKDVNEREQNSLVMSSLDGGDLGLLLRNTLREQGLVLGLLLLLVGEAPELEGSEVALALETDGGD
jgi:hypothetical protein